MSTNGKRVYVGLSGGVDSSLSALLLKRGGYDVIGVFIKAWQPESIPCTWKEDRIYAMRAAAHLEIPFVTWDLSIEYKNEIVDAMLRAYESGETPNPDIFCNERIKFGHFAKRALEEEGADYIATGHYARLRVDTDGTPHLFEGVDSEKDQSYFLSRVKGEVLSRTLFPVGGMSKKEVRKLAITEGLPAALKPDSQGLCFMGELDMKAFLKEHIPVKIGEVLSESGTVIGSHEGVPFYTVGERHGFTIHDPKYRKVPYYVLEKRVNDNVLVVGPRSDDRSSTTEILLRNVHTFSSNALKSDSAYSVRYRYHQVPIGATVLLREDEVSVRVTPGVYDASLGQTLAFYQGDECMGSGIISRLRQLA